MMLAHSLMALSALVAVQADATKDDGLAAGRELTRLLYTGDAAALDARLAPAFRAAIAGQGGTQAFIAQFTAQAGTEQEVLREAVFVEAGIINYYRVSRFERLPDVTARWVIGPDGLVQGAGIRPSEQAAASDRLAYSTQARLLLPFGRPAADGRWYVAWGGRTPIENYHVRAPDQRFAYDFLVARGPAVFAGDGARNEDHYCWGEPVLAPAAGTVAVAAGDFADNERPGTARENVPPTGNHVVIDHGRGEYSLIAHFQAGSLAVQAGQKVEAGALLGRCGNSGRSSVPHVHYHLQTGAAYGEGVGLPAFFNGYRADDVPVARGEPARGQHLLPGR